MILDKIVESKKREVQEKKLILSEKEIRTLIEKEDDKSKFHKELSYKEHSPQVLHKEELHIQRNCGQLLDKKNSHYEREIEKSFAGCGEVLDKKNLSIERNFKKSLKEREFSIIAEIKKASPSKGIIAEDFNPVEIAKLYETLPIAAISVLTEKKFFMGHEDYINKVREVTTKPILRKDFIVDTYELYESKYIGANAVLLICAVLGKKLPKFYNLAKTLGLDTLVEVHNEEELNIAQECGAEIIGINNRNLKDFTVDLGTTERLMKAMEKGKIVISESGIKTKEHIKYLKSLGVKGALIGESFMRKIGHKEKIIEMFRDI